MSPKHARKLARRATTVLAAAIASTLVAGTAYAYWSTTGSGSATATAGGILALGTGTATTTGVLYPNAGAITGSFLVTNSNLFDVQIDGVTFAGATPDSGHSGCTTTGVTFTPTSTFPLTVGKKVGSANGQTTVNFSASMDNTSLTACQGATFTSSYTFTAKSK